MSLVVRLKTGDAASRAAPLAGESVPEVLPPPQPALLDWATLTPAADAHLSPCPDCGAPNGLSASSCWNCEASLAPREPLWQGAAPPRAALVPQHSPADAEASFPVLTLAVKPDGPGIERPLSAAPTPALAAGPPLDPFPPPAAEGRSYTGIIGASIVVVAVAALGTALYLDTPSPAGAAKSGGGFISPPAPGGLTTVRPAPIPAEGLAGTGGAAPPAVPEMPRTAVVRALAVEPDAPVPAPTQAAPDPSALRAAPAAKARSPSRPVNEPTAPLAPKRIEADAYLSRQAPAPARPCTPTVAALGLCTGPSAAPAAPTAPTAPIESKE